jgi:DNA-binding transcriptional regulator GbsR (MarR family)
MLSAAVEFWVIVQVLVDLILVILFIIFMKQFRAISAKRTSSDIEPLRQALERLLKEADKVAGQFETQLKEKQRLVRRLNEHLDSRIISLNLLLNRAEVCLASHEKESCGENRPSRHVYDLQQEIIDLMEKGLTAQEIADRMGISKGEVTLVLELKRKFQEMGKSN